MDQGEFNKKWVGNGIQVPNTFNKLSGKININSGLDRIRQSIFMILSTSPGERLFLPEFGCDLYKLVFEPNDLILKDLLKISIQKALSLWEPRITVISVVPDTNYDTNIVPITITFKVKSLNIVDNYVYPFSRNARPLGGVNSYE